MEFDEQSVQDYLKEQYRGRQSFLEHIIFPIFGEEHFNDGYDAELLEDANLRDAAEKIGIRSVVTYGQVAIDLGSIQIFDITVTDHVLLARNRVAVQGVILDRMLSGSVFLTSKEASNGIHPHFDFVNKKINEEFPDLKIGRGIFGLSQVEKDELSLTVEELKLVKPYYTSEQVHRYFTEKLNALWIIYTSSEFKDPKKMVPYPRIKAHLDKVKKAITSDYRPYGLHRARKESFFKGEKIAVLRKCVGRPLFSYSDFPCYLSATFYIIKTDRWNMKFLTGVLNSQLIAYWLRHKGKMQGANYQLDKEPLMGIPLPQPGSCDEQPIAILVDKILVAKKENPDADTSALEKKIDELVFDLYGLEEAEREIIRQSVN